MKHQGNNLCKLNAKIIDLTQETTIKMIEEFHYAHGGPNTSVYRHGLLYENEVIGAALWLPPTKAAARASYGEEWRSVLSLSRLVCIPGAPRNSASFLIAGSIKKIRNDGKYKHLLTYADTWRGHEGKIYLATGWSSLGETSPSPVYVDCNGKMMGRKRGPKNFTHSEMLDRGFTMVGKFKKLRFGMTLA